jgi:hypothetical protein
MRLVNNNAKADYFLMHLSRRQKKLMRTTRNPKKLIVNEFKELKYLNNFKKNNSRRKLIC